MARAEAPPESGAEHEAGAGRAEKARTLLRLGPQNLARVGLYRALLKAGVYGAVLPAQPPLEGPFFDWPGAGAPGAPLSAGAPGTRSPGALPGTGSPGTLPEAGALKAPPGTDAAAWAADARRVLAGEHPAFSHRWVAAGFPPHWHRSVLTQVELETPQRHWTRVPDFGLPGGDIKGYREVGRFDGLLILTLAWLATRQDDFRAGIEAWLASWCAENPANVGVQWQCGQETGVRMMTLLTVADLLERWGGTVAMPSFRTLVAEHCARIAPTMLYAIGQDNNHGTSEAAALFAGGAYLVQAGTAAQVSRGAAWRATGRRWLENRLRRLVAEDGSFSQHSVNYHRMMLDACAFAETWRRRLGEPPFSRRFTARCGAATRWLHALVDPAGGDAPNLGANDGARLFALHRASYRDYRPSVQWASALFLARRAYPAGPHDELLAWLGLDAAPLADGVDAPAQQLWPDGGYAKLARRGAWLLLRLPRFRFRPSQADALHLDLWVNGTNVLRDGGSFSYNTDASWLRYFGGTASHNTVQLDGRDQMPRLSRFLFGSWLDCEELSFDTESWRITAAYRDWRGGRHRREVRLEERSCTVVDTVEGFSRSAVLRWRLAPPGPWRRGEDGWWTHGGIGLRVTSSVPPIRSEVVEGWESRHYGDKTPLPVLEVEVPSAAVITTEIHWNG